MNAPGENYRPDVDGLRAFAVLAVIVHHFSLDALPSGFLGVDVFFVISGFVITASLVGRSSATFADFLLDFYSRRVKRILPALILVVAATAILISLFNPTPSKSLRTGLAAVFGFSNIALYRGATDYFAESARLNAFTHTWSLGVEEQFYLVYPFLLWFAGGVRARRAGIVVVLGILSALSLAAFVILAGRNPNAAYFLMPTRFWELAAGALLCLALPRFPRLRRGLRVLSPGFVLVALLALFVAPIEAFAITTPAAVALTTLLIGALHPERATWRLLAHPVSVHLGRISYSLYLWHWTVLVISRWTIGIHWWTVPFQVLAMWAAAEASFRYVEDPLRRATWSARRGLTIARGVGAAVVTGAVLALMAGPMKGRLYTGRQPSLAAVGVETLRAPYAGADGRSIWRGEPCVISEADQLDKRIDVADCTLGDFNAARRRVLVAGNSVATAFVPAFDDLVAGGYAVTITSAWAAPPIPSLPTAGPWSAAHRHYWDDVFADLVARLRPGDAVFLISNMSAFASGNEDADQRALVELDKGLVSLSARLASRGVGLVVLNALPFAHEAECEPVVALKQWFAPFGGPCVYHSRTETLRRRAGLDAMLARQQAAGRLAVVDLMDVFCPGPTCTYLAADGQVLYRDATAHPSVEAARLSAGRIAEVMQRVAPTSGGTNRTPAAPGT